MRLHEIPLYFAIKTSQCAVRSVKYTGFLVTAAQWILLKNDENGRNQLPCRTDFSGVSGGWSFLDFPAGPLISCMILTCFLTKCVILVKKSEKRDIGIPVLCDRAVDFGPFLTG